MSLAAPGFVFRSCRRRYMPSSLGVRLFREPNAGDPPVRFDEREQETEPSQTGLRQLRESAVNRHRETKATAPVLDSTLLFAFWRVNECNEILRQPPGYAHIMCP